MVDRTDSIKAKRTDPAAFTPVSNLYNGSYIHVYIENDKITTIDKNWIEVKQNTVNREIKIEVLNKDAAVKIADSKTGETY